MGEVHALVAELATDLKDALKAAHDAALEGQLGGDAQVEVAVKRVEVRDERLGVGTTQDGMHHGGLDLHVAVGLHVAADEADDLAALAEGVADLGVHDEVDVALAVANLAVGETVELLGQRAQGLGEQLDVRGGNGELATASAQHGTGGADDVAQVKLAQERPLVLGQVVHAAEELDLRGAVLEHNEGGLALLAEGADATGEGVDVLGVGAVGEVCVALLEVGGVGRHRGVDGVGLDARVDKCLSAGAALRPLVVGAGGCGLLGHLVPAFQ